MTIFLSPTLNYRPVWAANDVPYDVISGVIAGLQKVYPHFSVMLDGLFHSFFSFIYFDSGGMAHKNNRQITIDR